MHSAFLQGMNVVVNDDGTVWRKPLTCNAAQWWFVLNPASMFAWRRYTMITSLSNMRDIMSAEDSNQVRAIAPAG